MQNMHFNEKIKKVDLENSKSKSAKKENRILNVDVFNILRKNVLCRFSLKCISFILL